MSTILNVSGQDTAVLGKTTLSHQTEFAAVGVNTEYYLSPRKQRAPRFLKVTPQICCGKITKMVNLFGVLAAVSLGAIMVINNQVEKPIPAQETIPAAMFLLDGSKSVGDDNFDVVKSFVLNITKNLDIDTDKGVVGVIQYSHYSRNYRLNGQPYIKTEIALGNYSNFENFKASLDNITLQGWTTYTAHALDKSLNDFRGYFSREYSRVIILVTDGKSNDANYLDHSVQHLKSFDINTIAIGVQAANITELEIITGDPNLVFLVTNFTELPSIVNEVTSKIKLL